MAKQAKQSGSRQQGSRFALLESESSEDELEEIGEASKPDETQQPTMEDNSHTSLQPTGDTVDDTAGWNVATYTAPHRRTDSHQTTVQQNVADGEAGSASTNWRNQGPPSISLFSNLNGVSLARQKLGVIVWRDEAREIHANRVKPSEGEVFTQLDQMRVLEKGRLFLITGRQKREITEYPIYTRDNTGLANKPADEHSQYASIRPLHIAAKDFINQVPGQKVLEMGELYDNRVTLRPNMVVRFSQAKSRDIDCDTLKIIGILTPESTEEMLRRGRSAIGAYET